MRKRFIPMWFLLAAITQLGATDCGDIIKDPGFDLWCGEQLCTWKLERGEIAQVSTWHDGDDGVELVGADTAISQLAPVNSDDGHCIEFELIADVDAGVDVRFQVDVFGDGSIDLDELIPAADWQPLVYRFDIDGWFDGVKFWIVKGATSGRAVVAQLAARICGDDETGSQTITGLPAPLGARCDEPSDCASGLCEQFEGGFPPPATCGACEVGAACPAAGDVCGLAPPALYTLAASTACVAEASKPLGAQCGVNAECADGLCVFGVCSSCFDASCGAGVACGPSVEVPRPDIVAAYPAPFVCAPGGGAGGAGEPCSAAADCASGTCDGAPRLVCTDGRACATDADCPAAGGLDHGTCATVGVLGGTCQ
jgi:hypothetical protein